MRHFEQLSINFVIDRNVNRKNASILPIDVSTVKFNLFESGTKNVLVICITKCKIFGHLSDSFPFRYNAQMMTIPPTSSFC